MEEGDEFVFCLDLSAQECWNQVTKWAKQKCQTLKVKSQLQDSATLLEKQKFIDVSPDAFMRMSCEILPLVGGSRPYMVFCIVRLVQELVVNDSSSAIINYRMTDFTACVIDYLQQGLDTEDLKNLLGATIDVVRLLLRRGRAPLVDYLCLFLTVAGANGTPLEVTRQLMATTNQLLEPLQRAQRSTVRTQLDNQLPALLSMLTTCGDYDLQASLVECLFRLSTHPERPALAATWLPSDELRSAFVAIANFDPDCRLLLNAFNRRLGAERKVHSFPAESVMLAGYALEKPDEPDYHHMWVDFNEGSNTITVYCQRPVTETQTDETLWETVTVRRDDVARARLRLDRHHQLVTLALDRPCRQLLSSGALEEFDGSEITFVFRKGHDLHTVLSRLYGAAYKFQACEELASVRAQKASATIRGVHCRSTSVSAPSATTASSSAGGSRAASHHKASVPLSTVISGAGPRPSARHPATVPKSSVPVLAGQRAVGGGRYSPLEMRSPGRELHRRRTSPSPPAEPAPAEAVPVSQSSGPSIIEPTPRPAATGSGPSTPGVSSTAQACVRTPQSHRCLDDSPSDNKAISDSVGRQSIDESVEQHTQQRQSQGVRASAVTGEKEQKSSGDGDLELRDEDSRMLEEERRQGGGQVLQESETQGKGDQGVQQGRHERQHESELKMHENAADRYQAQKYGESRKHTLSEQASSLDFEASSGTGEPSSVPARRPVPDVTESGAGKPTGCSDASAESRQRVLRRPRAATRPTYIELSDTSGGGGGGDGDSGGHDNQETSPSPPRRQRPPAARDGNNNSVSAATGGASRQHAKRAKGAREPTLQKITAHREEGSVRDTTPRAKRQTGKTTAGAKARMKRGSSGVTAGKREKPRPRVSFEERGTRRDSVYRKRSFYMPKDSSTEESPMMVQRSVYSQSDSIESEFTAPRHRSGKKSRKLRSPRIFSDAGTSTDGEKLPSLPPPPQQRVGTFKRYPIYDPRSVRNKALLSQESRETAQPQPQRGGRGRRGRGTASKRGTASARGAASSRGGTSQRGAASTKRGVSRSQPVGGWAERVSREERRLQSPEVLRDEPAPVDEHALSDVDVPPAKRRPDPGLASCFGWDSTGSESAVRLVELSPPVPAASSRATRRPSGRQRAGRQPASSPSPVEIEPCPEPAEFGLETAPEQEPSTELQLSGQHELCAELELSVPQAPVQLDTGASAHVSHLSVSATESAPPVSCPPNTPLSAGKVQPGAPTAVQLDDAMQWRAVSPQRVRPPVRDAAALTATQEFRLNDHLLLDKETSRPASPAPLDLRLHATDSPLPSPIGGPGANVGAIPLPPPPAARDSQRRSANTAGPHATRSEGEFRLPPPPHPFSASDCFPPPTIPQPLTTDDIRAELSAMVADWETTSVRSEQPHRQPGRSAAAAPLRQALAAIRRQVALLSERDERLHQLVRRSAATQETLLAQQRAAIATLEKLSETAAAARRRAAESILSECETLERLEWSAPGPGPGRGPAPPRAAATPSAATAAAGVESELESVQRELDQLLHAESNQTQPEWIRY